VAAIFAGSGPLLSLPLTVAVVALDGGLVPLCAVQGLAVAVPRLCAWVYWHRKPSWNDDTGGNRPLRLRLVLQMVTLSTAVLVQTGLDPVIVSSQLGADWAGAFGLASRVVTGALIPLTVITPLFAGNIAAARAAGWSARSDRDLRRLVAQAALAGAVVGALVVLLGPPLSRLLGAGQVDAPVSLYLAGGTFVFATFVSTPFYLAFSGPTGLRWSVRLNIVLTVANVGVSVLLVRAVGGSGPLWASAGAGLVAITFWSTMWARHPEWLGESHGPPVQAASPAPSPD
jgi:O-antigen/teichoic acid export membrane protein